MKRTFLLSFVALRVFGFDSTIPVVDMLDFYNEETKSEFVENVSNALHEVGFFAVINTGVDQKILDNAYQASFVFFSEDQSKKEEILKPELSGQRGYVLSETAQGFNQKDHKEFLHIGKENNIWPNWMDLENPMMALVRCLDKSSKVFQKTLSLAMGKDENYLNEMIENGESLLRSLHYPKNPNPGQFWAAEHTDIDFFTILPVSTEEGLQVFHDGKWIDVKVPENAFIINGGDMLQNLSNGYFKSSLHRVVSKPDVDRFSIVYFIHPRDGDPLDPLDTMVEKTESVICYPKATRMELLASRLRELKIASPELLEFEKKSGILDRIKELVERGSASEPVLKTYRLYFENSDEEVSAS